MPNKNEKYIKEMNHLVFSDDIKERITGNIIKYKKKRRKRQVVMAALVTVFLCIMAMKYSNVTNKMQSDFLCKEDIEKLNDITSIKDILTDADSNIDNLKIYPNQMIILNIQNMQGNSGSLRLTGRLTGDNRKYSYGYIVDKKYTEVLSDCTEEFINNQMNIKNGTEYSLYIINCSNKILTFSGNISICPEDLVYRDYGSEALRMEENSKIKIDLSGLCNSYDIEGIYLYNCITRQTIKFQLSSMIEYENKQAGVYMIYALTTEGKRIELSKNVTVEYSINEDGSIIGL